MRVLLITQLFDPENAIKGLSFAKGLVAKGYEVVVVTTFPSYPGGRIYPGYRMRLLQVDDIEGVRVVRVPSYITHDRSALKRLLGYASFSFCAFIYSLFWIRKPDVIYSYYPPLVGGLSGAALSVIKDCPLIYDVQDLWPEAVVATGMVKSRRVISIIEKLVGIVYKRAAAIVVLSEGYKRAILKKGVPEENIHRVYNWCDETRLSHEAGLGRSSRNSFDILYAGNLGKAQALEYIVQAADILQKRADNNIRFVFLGDGVEKGNLQNMSQSLGLQNIQFKPRVPPEAVGDELNSADALLVHLADDPVFSITVPQKTQAYLSAGKPILMAVAGESAEIIRVAGAGVSVRPCDAEDIANGAYALSKCSLEELNSFGVAAKQFYLNSMSQDNGLNQISRIINKVVGGYK